MYIIALHNLSYSVAAHKDKSACKGGRWGGGGGQRSWVSTVDGQGNNNGNITKAERCYLYCTKSYTDYLISTLLSIRMQLFYYCLMHVPGHCWTLTLRSCVQCPCLTSTVMHAWFVASIFKVCSLALRGDMVVQIDFFSLSNQDFAFRVI